MANEPISPGLTKLLEQSATGGQGALILAVVPGVLQGLVGTKLVDAGALTVAGVYRCIIPLAGMVATCYVYLKATFASGGVTSDVDTLYWVRAIGDPTTWTKKAAASGDGAMSTTVLQTITLPASGTLAGEQWAVVDITVDASTSVTFTQAEYCGT